MATKPCAQKPRCEARAGSPENQKPQPLILRVAAASTEEGVASCLVCKAPQRQEVSQVKLLMGIWERRDILERGSCMGKGKRYKGNTGSGVEWPWVDGGQRHMVGGEAGRGGGTEGRLDRT